MGPFALPSSPHFEKAVFTGSTMQVSSGWQTWTKPVGKSMVAIVAIGGGGGGGLGNIGANSVGGGGGGGGAGAISIIEIPMMLLPSRLYISVGHAKTGTGIASIVSTAPTTSAGHVLILANGGIGGGNSTGSTAGSAGGGGAAASASVMPLGWQFVRQNISGTNGTAGGSNSEVTAINGPTTGVRTTGGVGGGGLPAAGGGASGGGGILFTGQYSSHVSHHRGGAAPTSATNPANDGSDGFAVSDMGTGLFYFGGTGASSTHADATGPGLVQGHGGNGAIGCGGGGAGGALTGSIPATPSYGGSGMVMITCY
jgi:hypothetical protein